MKLPGYRTAIFPVLGLTALSAVFSALCFSPWEFTFFAWVALTPWIYGISKWSWKQVLWSTAIYDVVFFGIGISWMATVHILSPIAILIPLYVMILPFPVLLRWTLRNTSLPMFLVAPIFWVATDYWRGVLFTGFPWLYLSHTQAFKPHLIQIADITGAHGVTFLLVMVNAALVQVYCHWSQSKKSQEKVSLRSPLIAVGVTLLLVISSLLYGKYCLGKVSSKEGPKVATLQGNIPQDLKDDPEENREHILKAYCRLSMEALAQKPDLLVWPETMAPRALLYDPQTWQMFYDLTRESKTPVLLGSHHLEINPETQETKSYNSGFLMDAQGKIVDRYDKIRLVPVGEAIPFGNFLPFIPALVKVMVGYVPDLQVGTKRPAFPLGEYKFGTLVCFDIIFSEESRLLAKKGCDFVINITNEGWFAHSSELEQILAISIFRAVENRIGVLRAGNTGITVTIPPSGVLKKENILTIPISDYKKSLSLHMQQRLQRKKQWAWHRFPEALWRKDLDLQVSAFENWDIDWEGEKLKWKDFPGLFIRKIPIRSEGGPTFYTTYGDVFVWLNCLFSIGIIALWFKNPQKPPQE